jgi:hypothetical protein
MEGRKDTKSTTSFVRCATQPPYTQNIVELGFQGLISSPCLQPPLWICIPKNLFPVSNEGKQLAGSETRSLLLAARIIARMRYHAWTPYRSMFDFQLWGQPVGHCREGRIKRLGKLSVLCGKYHGGGRRLMISIQRHVECQVAVRQLDMSLPSHADFQRSLFVGDCRLATILEDDRRTC